MVSISVQDDPLGTTYCSKACQSASSSTSHNVLFGGKLLVSPDPSASNLFSPAEQDENQRKRRQAQEAFIAHIRSTGKLSPLLLARFVARMISNEIAKVLPGESTLPPPSDLPEPDDGVAHAFYDHVDRLRYLDVPETEAEKLEMTLLKDMLTGAMPGLEEFIKDERYLVLKGKVLFNTIGIAYSGGRLNKVRNSTD
jgi:import receptor subunit TOM20